MPSPFPRQIGSLPCAVFASLLYPVTGVQQHEGRAYAGPAQAFLSRDVPVGSGDRRLPVAGEFRQNSILRLASRTKYRPATDSTRQHVAM